MLTYPSSAPLILGKSYRQWIIDWWNQKQDEREDGVFLLFADYEGELPDYVEIPPKKQALFTSPINYIHALIEEEKEEKVREEVKYEIDIINKNLIKVEFDGMQLGHLCTRMDTGFFTLNDGRRALSDGYWLFLKGPFEEGEHMLSSYGTCKSGQIQISTNTTLTVYQPQSIA